MTGVNSSNANPTVIATLETRNLKTPPFLPTDDQITTGKEWEDWLDGIEREFRYFRIKDAEDKKDAMIIFGGKEIARLAKSLPDPTTADLDEYMKLKTKLNEYFIPMKNKHHARYLFLKIRPEESESTVTYATRVREKANECEFGDSHEERILEHIIQTISNNMLIQKAIHKKWNLGQFLEGAAEIEDTSLQIQNMKERTQVAKVQEYRKPDYRKQQYRQPDHRRRENGRQEQKKVYTGRQDPKAQPCGYCGLTGVHKPGENCPAYGKRCSRCTRMHHFASVCESIPPTKPRDNQRKYKNKTGKYQRRVRKTTEEEKEEENATSSDDEYFDQAVRHLKQVHVKRVKKIHESSKLISIRMDDVDCKAEPDSGADVNIMDEHQFKALINRSNKIHRLETSQIKLKTLQSELPIKGEFHTVVRNKTRGVTAKFIVIKGRIDSPPLICKKTLIELGMMKIQEDGSLAEPNNLKIEEDLQTPSVKIVSDQRNKNSDITEIVDKHKKVFEGIGEIRDIKHNKEIYAHICMKPEAVPIAQRPRQVAYHLQKPLKEWIQQGIKEDIFEEVPQGEPVTWCSPLVVQPKPRYSTTPIDKLESHMIRASVDLRLPNKYMERNRITQGPIVEDFTYKFNNCRVFSKLDMRQGYHQLKLDPESRAIATFSTPWGNIRPKRLIFGAKSSQDMFDETIYRIFSDIPGCLNQRDDILLGGKNMEEHNKTLETVLQRAADFGITFNMDKCLFGVEELDFYGYRFTKDGLKPAKEKVRAVKESQPPQSKEAVRSFLGMIGYLSKFIPRYTSLTAPLRELTHKDVKFKWEAQHDVAFQKLKDSITSEDTMAYFNPCRPTIVRTEASYHEGLSAGLFQKTRKGLQPVHFISRTMTDTEKRYSQTEKDALAIRWAKNRFSMYLLGAPRFTIITAHKPLIPMFNKATAKLPPRIEKWVMDMQNVDYELVYEPGKDDKDPLDFLSRHPMPETGTDNIEKVIKHVVTTQHAIILDSIKKETEEDCELRKLKERINQGDWESYKKDPDISPYYMIRQELYMAEGMIFRLNQIVIPEKLRRKTIKAAHSLGHLGMSKTKQMLREKYWFPTMNSMVEEIIGKCYECQVTTKAHKHEPIKMTPIPDKPWDVISADFGGPYPDGHYNLVIIDKRTRYPEVEIIQSTAFQPTRDKLKKIFATHGTANKLETDNGPPWNSEKFKEFAKEEGFYHHRVTPLHPKANGEAESFMKVLNKTEQIAHLQGENSINAVQEMLVGYRSTPHPATGVTPYQALMNRPVRTKLDYIKPNQEGNDQDAYMNERDKSYKERLKENAENRNTKSHSFIVGDYVLLKQRKRNKWSTAYEPAFYIIYRINGSAIAARRIIDGREMLRDASQFKLANRLVGNMEEPENDKGTVTDWREDVLLRAKPNRDDPVPDDPIELDNNDIDREPEGIPRRPVRDRQRPVYLKDYVL